MEKKYVVALKDAVTGVLHGRAGTFRVLIDEESSGAKHFSLLVNTMNAGVKVPSTITKWNIAGIFCPAGV